MERINVDKPAELKPNISANVFFHFMTKIDWLKESLEKKALIPLYCEENIAYMQLNVDNYILNNVAYPEKCFCDIPLHKVSEHLEDYGDYGIGFYKKWGIEKGLQPIQYINISSNLLKDFQECINKSMTVADDNKDALAISNYLISHMLYMKPITGVNISRKNNESREKYLTDECEWRYVPDLTQYGMEVILFDNDIKKKVDKNMTLKEKYNAALKTLDKCWLKYDYDDVKYIVVKNYIEREQVINIINDLNNGVGDYDKMKLISKIIVLCDAEEDF